MRSVRKKIYYTIQTDFILNKTWTLVCNFLNKFF